MLFLFSVEKEQQDNAQKLKDSAEAGNRVLELQRKLEHAREVVSQMDLFVFLICGSYNFFVSC